MDESRQQLIKLRKENENISFGRAKCRTSAFLTRKNEDGGYTHFAVLRRDFQETCISQFSVIRYFFYQGASWQARSDVSWTTDVNEIFAYLDREFEGWTVI